MYQAYEATIDQTGNVHVNETIQLPAGRRALVIVLDHAISSPLGDTALAGEETLANIWNRPEEDEAWSYLQSEK